ncbi:hypothetical protein [Paraburkholderia rhizosphaerae]|uniref:Uncharacterized protein n=1 Tax=Paraburkholderia rhizosphaerae TaxID=480658 RepID=A0A4R8LJ80_9BURK|nr:hypothetical protein [Paraburkholderia rhizosphaerae]TDY42493.1 hypothetical protein BX592_12164 [Paraburkholderia rhizosphaerae]
MDTRRIALLRRGLLVSAASCVSIGMYVGGPSSFADTFNKVGADTELPLETLAIEQVKVEEEIISRAHRDTRTRSLMRDRSRTAPSMQFDAPAAQTSRGTTQGPVRDPAFWESRAASTTRPTGRDTHESTPGVVRSIRFEEFKHWT